MATSKTLTPTNVTIQIPAFTDQPDQRVNSNCIDKEADAINALNDQIATLNSKMTSNQLVTFVTKTYTNQSVSASGIGGYYCSGDDIAVPSGYTPVSACWGNDFQTCVFPIVYYNNKWMVALNSPKSVTGVSGTVRIMCVKNTVA